MLRNPLREILWYYHPSLNLKIMKITLIQQLLQLVNYNGSDFQFNALKEHYARHLDDEVGSKRLVHLIPSVTVHGPVALGASDMVFDSANYATAAARLVGPGADFQALLNPWSHLSPTQAMLLLPSSYTVQTAVAVPAGGAVSMINAPATTLASFLAARYSATVPVGHQRPSCPMIGVRSHSAIYHVIGLSGTLLILDFDPNLLN